MIPMSDEAKAAGRLAYFPTDGKCLQCGTTLRNHIPTGTPYAYLCPEWALRQKDGNR